MPGSSATGDAVPRVSGVAKPAGEPAGTAGERQRGAGGGSLPVGGLAGRPADSSEDAEHHRKYEYGERADGLFLDGLPPGAADILDADPADAE